MSQKYCKIIPKNNKPNIEGEILKLSLEQEKIRAEKELFLKHREQKEYEIAILESKRWYEDYLKRLEMEEEELNSLFKLCTSCLIFKIFNCCSTHCVILLFRSI